jgi:guanylate kinase
MQENKLQSPLLIVISAPSGAGKTTLCKLLLDRDKNLSLSISATTRPPRKNEVNGKDYFFLTEKEFFIKVKNGEFLEYEQVHGYYYGTLQATVDKLCTEGKSVLFDIDVNGGLTIKEKNPEALLIFILPPSIDELKKRLQQRETDTEEERKKRLARLPIEIDKSKYFDYKVVNNDLIRTVIEIENIIKNKNLRSNNVSHSKI